MFCQPPLGGRHLRKQQRDTLPGFYAIPWNFARNFATGAGRTATFRKISRKVRNFAPSERNLRTHKADRNGLCTVRFSVCNFISRFEAIDPGWPLWPSEVKRSLFPIAATQGRRHEVLIGGGGTDSWAPNPTYLQNLVSPRISATFVKMLENAKL